MSQESDDPLKKPVREISQEEIERMENEGGFGGDSPKVPAFLRDFQKDPKGKHLPEHIPNDPSPN